MLGVGGAHKPIIGRIHHIPYALDFVGNSVHELLGSYLRRRGFELDFLAVLVRTRLKIHVVALHTLRARNEVGKHNFIGVADVRLARRIRDSGSKIIFLFFHIHLRR